MTKGKPAPYQPQKATSPAPPPQNPWNKGASAPKSASGTVTPAAQAAMAAPLSDKVQVPSTYKKADIEKMFADTAKENAKGLAPESRISLSSGDRFREREC